MKSEAELNTPNAHRAAHPFLAPDGRSEGECGIGLTKREWMATIICAGMCANGDISAAMSDNGMKPNEIRASLSESAVKLADELLCDLALAHE